MKTIEAAAEEYALEFVRKREIDDMYISQSDLLSTKEDFKAGIEFAQRWIPIEEELPELGVEVLFKNEKWINEDYNPDGVRIGFRDDGAGYVTAYYCSYHDEYHTRNSEEDNGQFEQAKAEDQIPTHWRPINIK